MGVVRGGTKWAGSALGIILAVLLSACSNGGSSGGDGARVTAFVPERAVVPAVTSTAPADTAVGVGTNVKVIAVFNQAMNAGTIDGNSFTLKGNNEPPIVGALFYDSDTRSVVLDPNSDLSDDTLYTAVISTSVEDKSGVSLPGDFSWTFRTGIGPDSTGPTISSSMPVDGATGVPRNTKITITFNEAIDPETINAANVSLYDNGAGSAVAGSLLYLNPTTVVLSPGANLGADSLHTLALSGAITDLADNPLAPIDITFTTGADVSQSPAAVDLKTAGNYVLLAETGITDAGTHKITGNIGISPGTQAALSGFGETLSSDGTYATSPLVTGKLFASDMAPPTPTVLSIAITDMRDAYTDAATRTDPDFTGLGAGEIGGMTLDPGLYKWQGDVSISRDLTLDGDASGVWIFQVGGDLRLRDNNAIILSGGALRNNVFWQVGGRVILQSGSTFYGVALAKTEIVLESGARINGRGLAQTDTKLVFKDPNQSPP